MNILTAYYRISAYYLEKYVPYIPKLKLTNAKGYCGQIQYNHKTKEFNAIYLSKLNLEVSEKLIEEEDIDEIIETICHEFAHMLFWDHGEDHAELTKNFVTIVKSSLKIHSLQKQLQV